MTREKLRPTQRFAFDEARRAGFPRLMLSPTREIAEGERAWLAAAAELDLDGVGQALDALKRETP